MMVFAEEAIFGERGEEGGGRGGGGGSLDPREEEGGRDRRSGTERSDGRRGRKEGRKEKGEESLVCLVVCRCLLQGTLCRCQPHFLPPAASDQTCLEEKEERTRGEE
eukprot:764161-Hanusia_phi.AAC.5